MRNRRKDLRAAPKAIERCVGVPYWIELNRSELRCIKRVERKGEVKRDVGGLNMPWHRRR